MGEFVIQLIAARNPWSERGEFKIHAARGSVVSVINRQLCIFGIGFGFCHARTAYGKMKSAR